MQRYEEITEQVRNKRKFMRNKKGTLPGRIPFSKMREMGLEPTRAYTHKIRVVVIPCGFDSHLLQAENRNFQYGDSCFYVHFFCSRPARHQTVRHRRHIRSFSGPAAGRLFPILFRNIRTCGSAHNQCGVKYHPFRLFLWVFQLF